MTTPCLYVDQQHPSHYWFCQESGTTELCLGVPPRSPNAKGEPFVTSWTTEQVDVLGVEALANVISESGSHACCPSCASSDRLVRFAVGFPYEVDKPCTHPWHGESTPERAGREFDTQPLPHASDTPVMHKLVQEDLEARLQVGIKRYGQPLQARNGRDALRDLYEELLDGCVYIRQVIWERDNPQ